MFETPLLLILYKSYSKKNKKNNIFYSFRNCLISQTLLSINIYNNKNVSFLVNKINNSISLPREKNKAKLGFNFLPNIIKY